MVHRLRRTLRELPRPSSTPALWRRPEEEFLSLKRRRTSLLERLDTARNARAYWLEELSEYQRNLSVLQYLSLAIILITSMLGYLAYPLIYRWFFRTGERIKGLTAGGATFGPQTLVGFLAGVVIAIIVLLALFSTLVGEGTLMAHSGFRLGFGALAVLILGSAGAIVGSNYFGPSRARDPYASYHHSEAPKLLDTSVIIDGRIYDVAVNGFLGGLLIVTNSVLRELQALSDSADERKRLKGRRGLELLRKMQENPMVQLEIFDDSGFDAQSKGTDEQLMLLAEAMGAIVITNDTNLNRVATLRDVRVVNMNALANAVKVNHVPGEYIDLEITDRGKQHGQGVGYLDDGTMVVVEDGEPYIGRHKTVRLTSVSQTVQGRLLFGRVDAAEQGGGDGHR